MKPTFPGHPACTLVNVLSSKHWTSVFFFRKNHVIYERKRKSPSHEVYRLCWWCVTDTCIELHPLPTFCSKALQKMAMPLTSSKKLKHETDSTKSIRLHTSLTQNLVLTQNMTMERVPHMRQFSIPLCVLFNLHSLVVPLAHWGFPCAERTRCFYWCYLSTDLIIYQGWPPGRMVVLHWPDASPGTQSFQCSWTKLQQEINVSPRILQKTAHRILGFWDGTLPSRVNTSQHFTGI
jgi:hypothetical protein